ncbi:MAG: competence/damage-inducible protein A [Deltaproteobacteria bacterium]|nr:competence/damage-inducible protein A [Nannocystaceae bacterium]
MSALDVPTACVLLIGDELLTGKVRDENGFFLAKLLRRRGIRLVEISTVGDDPGDIGRALVRLCTRASIVFTSGGVGPTHDDRTLYAIARVLDRPLVRNVEMEAQLRHYYGERINEAALRMADLPGGTLLRALPGWPVLRLDLDTARVYILPGVPSLLRAKLEHLEAIEGELPLAPGWHLATVHTSLDESKLAPLLDAVLAEFAGIDIGSYPRWSRSDDGRVHVHVRVTFEGPSGAASRVEAARDRLREALPADRLLDDEPAV